MEIFLIKFGKLLLLMFSGILLDSVTLSSLSETPVMCMLVCLMVSYRSLRICSFFFLFFKMDNIFQLNGSLFSFFKLALGLL